MPCLLSPCSAVCVSPLGITGLCGIQTKHSLTWITEHLYCTCLWADPRALIWKQKEGKGDWKDHGRDLGLRNTVLKDVSPQNVRPRKRLDIHSGYLKWKTYFCYSRFTTGLVKGMLTILLVLSFFLRKEGMQKDFHS